MRPRLIALGLLAGLGLAQCHGDWTNPLTAGATSFRASGDCADNVSLGLLKPPAIDFDRATYRVTWPGAEPADGFAFNPGDTVPAAQHPTAVTVNGSYWKPGNTSDTPDATSSQTLPVEWATGCDEPTTTAASTTSSSIAASSSTTRPGVTTTATPGESTTTDRGVPSTAPPGTSDRTLPATGKDTRDLKWFGVSFAAAGLVLIIAAHRRFAR